MLSEAKSKKRCGADLASMSLAVALARSFDVISDPVTAYLQGSKAAPGSREWSRGHPRLSRARKLEAVARKLSESCRKLR